MTQQELREFIFKLTTTMIAKKAYIKGYGDKFRVMDHTHSPYINIDRRCMEVLQYNNIVKQDGLIWVMNVAASPFTHKLDIKLPLK